MALTLRLNASRRGDEPVALGSDFDGGVVTPFDRSALPELTAVMLEAGMSDASIRRFWEKTL